MWGVDWKFRHEGNCSASRGLPRVMEFSICTEQPWWILFLHTLPSTIAFKLLLPLFYRLLPTFGTSKCLAKNDARNWRNIVKKTSWHHAWELCYTPWCKMTCPCTSQSRGNFCPVCKNIWTSAIHRTFLHGKFSCCSRWKKYGDFWRQCTLFLWGLFFYQSSVWLSCVKMQLCRWLFFSTMQFCGYPSFKVNLVGCLGRMRKTFYNSVKGGSTEKKSYVPCGWWGWLIIWSYGWWA